MSQSGPNCRFSPATAAKSHKPLHQRNQSAAADGHGAGQGALRGSLGRLLAMDKDEEPSSGPGSLPESPGDRGLEKGGPCPAVPHSGQVLGQPGELS